MDFDRLLKRRMLEHAGVDERLAGDARKRIREATRLRKAHPDTEEYRQRHLKTYRDYYSRHKDDPNFHRVRLESQRKTMAKPGKMEHQRMQKREYRRRLIEELGINEYRRRNREYRRAWEAKRKQALTDS